MCGEHEISVATHPSFLNKREEPSTAKYLCGKSREGEGRVLNEKEMVDSGAKYRVQMTLNAASLVVETSSPGQFSNILESSLPLQVGVCAREFRGSGPWED
ncbi:hypothetical protein NPIL_250101 [Nephila pilipes]|uniref:Uncharacterized protein n=1 Tax=Nephila pilipes TaxID=299642 RepID=A0A8X6TGX4_NEPPI|nr:hypothetical protein NPIL_250101 [Nephila pilipes]